MPVAAQAMPMAIARPVSQVHLAVFEHSNTKNTKQPTATFQQKEHRPNSKGGVPVAAQAMPTAIAAPYRRCGLYDSDSSLTMRGHCSGTPSSTNPRLRTAARRTSSLTSDTAKWSRRWIAELLSVPRYAIPMAYMPPKRRMGSCSVDTV